MSYRYLYTQIKSVLENPMDNRAIVIYGARRVGKTTLVKNLLSNYHEDTVEIFNGENPSVIELFRDATLSKLIQITKNKKIIFIDEAHFIPEIGISVKLIVDNIPNVKLILTGSSSFELRSKIAEPMTGRTHTYKMYPMSFVEISNERKLKLEDKDGLLEEMLLYGGYPQIVDANFADKSDELETFVNDYLYKDILSFERLKKSELIIDLVTLLADYVGSEVSYNKLANNLRVDSLTIQKYINILEDSFILFKLRTLSRSVTNEIRKSRKIYFYDNGVLNSIKNNFSKLEVRSDKGALFENLMISERLKRNASYKIRTNKYFWRTRNDSEVDYIEEKDGKFNAYDFKANYKFPKTSELFNSMYNADGKVINFENYREFIE